MTKVKVIVKKQYIHSIECDGHTGYGVEGEDIVCAALSSIVQTAALGVFMVAKVNAQMKRNNDNAFISIIVPENISKEQQHDCEVILQTMLLGIRDLYEGYSDFIELEVKEDVY